MKNKVLIISLIILLSLIIILLISSLVIILHGGTDFRNVLINFGTRNYNAIYDQEFKNEDIENIEITQEAGDIIFKESSDDNIQIIAYGENENNVNVDLNNNKLTIDYTNNSSSTFNFGITKNDIVIYIPSDYSNKITIKDDYGNCKLTDLENATVNIDSDAGNIELGKIKNATISCDYGNVEIKEILNKCDIKADCGNIEIDKLYIQEDSTIKADLGNVDIDEINDIYIDANVDLGKTNIYKNDKTSNITLKINCDCGNINIGK